MYFKTTASLAEVARNSTILLKNQNIFLSAIALFFLLVAVCIGISLQLNQWNFIYPLDDTYIHMTIARNLALHGTWGMSPEVFSSASSSILYTLLLAAAFYTGGVNDFVPLILNVCAALLVIYYFYRIAQSRGVDARYFAFILLLLIVGVSMIPLTISGMEHTWQVLIDLAFLYGASRYIAARERRLPWGLLVLGALATMARYEGIFLVGIIAGMMVLRGQYMQAGLVLVAGMIPVVLFGVYSLSQGGYFLPNSLLLKGHTPELSAKGLYAFATDWLVKLIEDPHLLILFSILTMLSLIVLYRAREKWKMEHVALWTVSLLFIAHLTFARTGWFYRYEAYLMALSFFVFMLAEREIYPLVKELPRRYLAVSLTTVMAVFAVPLLLRGLYTIWNTPIAMNNIYSQQYQMASFIHRWQPGLRVVANDIGAISYYNDIHLLDFFGLANRQVLDLKRANRFTKQEIEALAIREQMELALIYDYPSIIPATWIKIGEWTIRNNVVCENSTVALYLIDREEDKKNQIVEAFNSYVQLLPRGITYKSYFP